MRPTIESTIEHIKEECNSDYGEVAIKAIKKQIPMPVATHTVFNDYLQAWERIRVCPVCGIDTPVPRALEIWERWCPDCGQRLDWSKPKGDSYDFAIIDEVIAYDTQKKD